jgi:protein phosphatase
VDGEGYWLVLNIGDSRTYLLSDGVFEQMSVDHSVVQELIDSGELDAAAAAVDGRRNVITRAIGGGGFSEADFWLVPAEAGDRVLVCSDGLSGELADDEISAILRAEHAPQAAAARLVEEARLRGGRDNITAVVVDALAVRSHAGADAHSTLPTAAQRADLDTFDADTRPRVGAGGSPR